MLPMAEYAYNNSPKSTVKMRPFFANFCKHPRTNWPTTEPSENPNSQNHIQWITSVHQVSHQRLKKASETMRKWHDEEDKSAPVYRSCDWIMLNGKNLKIKRPAKKLDAKLHGPFEVMKVLPPTALELELPVQWRIHNACQVSIIDPFHIARNRIGDPPNRDPMVTDDHELGYDVQGYEYKTGHEVEDMECSQCNKEWKMASYLVKWNGFPAETDWTEEPYGNFNRKKLPREFQQRNPQVGMDKMSYVKLVPLLLGDIVVPRDINSKQ